MSQTGAAQAKAARTTRKKHEAHCVRPADVPSNSALPRYGWLVQHALYPSLATVLKAIDALKPEELPNRRGRLLRHASIAKIASATASLMPGSETGSAIPMPHRTVGHCLAALARKGFIEAWEVKARTSPFGTSYRLRPYREIIDRWAADPAIGTVTDSPGGKAFFVLGKSRRHLTPGELVEWQIDYAAATRDPTCHAGRAAIEEPLTAAEAKGATLGGDIDAIHAALCDVLEHGSGGSRRFIDGLDAEQAHACRVIEAARLAVPDAPIAAIAGAVRSIRVDKFSADLAKAGRKPTYTTPGWVLSRITGAMHAWRHAQRDRAAG